MVHCYQIGLRPDRGNARTEIPFVGSTSVKRPYADHGCGACRPPHRAIGSKDSNLTWRDR